MQGLELQDKVKQVFPLSSELGTVCNATGCG